MAGNDPVKTDADVVSEQLDQIARSADEQVLIVPEIPYTPPSARLQQQMPELGSWYASFHAGMTKWKDELNQELTR